MSPNNNTADVTIAPLTVDPAITKESNGNNGLVAKKQPSSAKEAENGDDLLNFVDIEEASTVNDSDSLSDEINIHTSTHDNDDDDNIASNIHLMKAHPEELSCSIRHVDSLLNFCKHKEQMQADKEKQTDKAEASSIEEAPHKVKFPSNDKDLAVVHVIPQVDQADYCKVWLTPLDFERQEKDLKMTCWRWENHLSGAMPFDEANNSIRGLEYMFSLTQNQQQQPQQQPSVKRRHRQAVFAELKRQKEAYQNTYVDRVNDENAENDNTQSSSSTTKRFVLDHDALQEVSERVSVPDMQKAIGRGMADAEASRQAWCVVAAESKAATLETSDNQKKFNSKKASGSSDKTNQNKKKGFLSKLFKNNKK